MVKQEFVIERIGEAKIDNPIRMSSVHGDGSADYVEDTDKIYLNIDHDESDGSGRCVGACRPEKKDIF